MERLTSTLIQWKAVYEAHASAQNALMIALRTHADDKEVDALRQDVRRLHVKSEAALKALDDEVAEFRLSRMLRIGAPRRFGE
jgi:hypothetical protein